VVRRTVPAVAVVAAAVGTLAVTGAVGVVRAAAVAVRVVAVAAVREAAVATAGMTLALVADTVRLLVAAVRLAVARVTGMAVAVVARAARFSMAVVARAPRLLVAAVAVAVVALAGMAAAAVADTVPAAAPVAVAAMTLAAALSAMRCGVRAALGPVAAPPPPPRTPRRRAALAVYQHGGVCVLGEVAGPIDAHRHWKLAVPAQVARLLAEACVRHQLRHVGAASDCREGARPFAGPGRRMPIVGIVHRAHVHAARAPHVHPATQHERRRKGQTIPHRVGQIHLLRRRPGDRYKQHKRPAQHLC
jgi:hypothetical protein